VASEGAVPIGALWLRVAPEPWMHPAVPPPYSGDQEHLDRPMRLASYGLLLPVPLRADILMPSPSPDVTES
jgi:hypothetical protein